MSADPAKHGHRIVFFGKLDERMRQLIRAKRLELGLSYQRLAVFFKVDWSTIRKWEQGPTNTCNVLCQSKLESFINGELDHLLSGPYSDSGQQLKKRLPGSVRICQRQLEHAHELLQGHADLQEELLQNVLQVAQESLCQLVQRQAPAGGVAGQ